MLVNPKMDEPKEILVKTQLSQTSELLWQRKKFLEAAKEKWYLCYWRRWWGNPNAGIFPIRHLRPGGSGTFFSRVSWKELSTQNSISSKKIFLQWREIQDILKLKKTENLPPAGMAKGSSLHRKEIIKEGLLETQEGERSMERVKI